MTTSSSLILDRLALLDRRLDRVLDRLEGLPLQASESDPYDTVDDPFSLLDCLEESASAEIVEVTLEKFERLLLDADKVVLWSEFVRAAQDVIAENSGKGPPKETWNQAGAEELTEVLNLIETTGLVPAAQKGFLPEDERKTRSPAEVREQMLRTIRALFWNPDQLLDLHFRVWTNESKYWQERRRESHHLKTLREGSERRPVVPVTSLSPPQSKKKGWWWGKAVGAAAAVLLVGVGGPLFIVQAVNATNAQLVQDIVQRNNVLWQQLEDARSRLGLRDYISFAGDDKDHPSADPARARPLVTAGRDVILKGRAKPSLIKAIEATFELTTEPGKAVQKETVEISPVGDSDVGLFEKRFTMPEGGPPQQVTIRLIPRNERAKTELRGRLIYPPVRVACTPDGAVAYVSADEAPEITSTVKAEGGKNVVKVTVKARTRKGSFVVVSNAATGGRVANVSPPRYVSNFGDEITFTISLGSEEEHELRAYAAYDADLLSRKEINKDQLNKVLAGKVRTYRIPMN